MSVADTSIEAYAKVKLGPNQTIVHQALGELGKATDLEIADYLDKPINEVTPRRSELVEYGYIKEDGRKMNRTGNSAKAWVLSDPSADKVIKRIETETYEAVSWLKD